MDIKRTHAQFHLEDKTGTLSIRNATRLNLLDSAVIEDLIAVLDEIRSLDHMHSLVFRGEGDDAFIAGAHIKEMSGLNPETARNFIRKLKALCDALYHFPTPVIARIPGWCLGGGLEVALACDLRIIANEAHVGMPEVKVGIPSVIHATLLPRFIGTSRSDWMLLTGENIDATTATEWGMMTECAPLTEIDARVEKLTQQFSELGPKVLRQQKALNRRWLEIPLSQAIEETVQAFGQAFTTGEPEHYMNKFLNEKK